MSSLDDKLMDALKTIIRDGRYTGINQFLVYINEPIGSHNRKDGPMNERLKQAAEDIKQSFVDDGWIKITQGEPFKYLEHIDDDGTIWLGKTYPVFVDQGEKASGIK